MGEASKIEWTDETWNPVTGCTKVSPGCAHCYAETLAERFRGVPGHPFEQGFDLKLWPERLTKPLSWKKPRKVFVNSMSDLFHEDVPFEFIDRVMAVMALTPKHTYQVLTKRPERMREYLTQPADPDTGLTRWEWVSWLMGEEHTGYMDYHPEVQPTWPLPNVWLGTSVELQRWADVRIPELLATPAAVRFLSCEPLLGPVDLRLDEEELCGPGPDDSRKTRSGLHWVIVGGESGPGARPFDLAWARSLVSQCRAAGVAVFVKQLGASPVANYVRDFEHSGALAGKLKDRKGGDWTEWPADLRVREFPESVA